jgi:hypothetical protein
MKSSTQRLILLLLLWGVAASLAGATHLLAHLPLGFTPVLVALPAIALTTAALRPTWVRDAISRIDSRAIVAIHLIRFAGFYFLWLQTKGRLPIEFAQRAGWGDVIAASGALVLLFVPEGPAFRRAFVAWNAFGLLDLFVAVGTAAWLNATRRGSVIELAGLPLTLVPLFFVPVMMASHFVLLRRRGASAGPQALAAGQQPEHLDRGQTGMCAKKRARDQRRARG